MRNLYASYTPGWSLFKRVLKIFYLFIMNQQSESYRQNIYVGVGLLLVYYYESMKRKLI
jgi:hypothetical protein